MGRSSVFDPSRLDEELDELLPPPSRVPVAVLQDEPPTVTDVAEAPAPDSEPVPDSAASAAAASLEGGPTPDSPYRSPHPAQSAVATATRRPRGSGGRPPAQERAPAESPSNAPAIGGFIVVAARIPTHLWDAVINGPLSGRERPSYAQLITWTCQDQPDDVVRQIRANLAPDRTPRGRRLAAPVNTITVRFRHDELAAFDELLETASTAGQRVTRTAGIIAALQVSSSASTASS